jgi:hypothetical protein
VELNREVLNCMKELRRRLRDELAVDIRMSQPDAIELMLSGCRGSSNEETRQLGQLLAQYSGSPVDKPAAIPAAQDDHAPLPEPDSQRSATSSVRYYRGQRVYVGQSE